MGINIGIVGLPNVGKSTLFNALCAAGAESANFPFCTIEPNVGVVDVPDPRVAALAAIYGSAKVLPASLEFVDIAGLVAGASRGEGLGNQFLAHIRQVDAIAQVVRCFADEDVVHVAGGLDPVRDLEIVETELLLADLGTVERRLERLGKQARAAGAAGAEARAETAALEPLREAPGRGEAALRQRAPSEGAEKARRQLSLLTDKPTLVIANVEEAHAARFAEAPQYDRLAAAAAGRGAPLLAISAAIEAEVAQLEPADRAAYLSSMGLDAPGLHALIRAGYALLDRITFFTAGPKETRAWTLPRGTSAPAAAGTIHSDFERGFIRAEVMACADLVDLGGEAAVRQAGRLRVEGKDYRIQDGDVVNFRFNV